MTDTNTNTRPPAPEDRHLYAQCDCGKVVPADPRECAMLSDTVDPVTGYRTYYCGHKGWGWV